MSGSDKIKELAVGLARSAEEGVISQYRSGFAGWSFLEGQNESQGLTEEQRVLMVYFNVWMFDYVLKDNYDNPEDQAIANRFLSLYKAEVFGALAAAGHHDALGPYGGVYKECMSCMKDSGGATECFLTMIEVLDLEHSSETMVGLPEYLNIHLRAIRQLGEDLQLFRIASESERASGNSSGCLVLVVPFVLCTAAMGVAIYSSLA